MGTRVSTQLLVHRTACFHHVKENLPALLATDDSNLDGYGSQPVLLDALKALCLGRKPFDHRDPGVGPDPLRRLGPCPLVGPDIKDRLGRKTGTVQAAQASFHVRQAFKVDTASHHIAQPGKVAA